MAKINRKNSDFKITRINFQIYLIITLLSTFSVLAQNELSDWIKPVNLEELNSKSDEFAPIFNKYTGLFIYNSTKSGSSVFYSSEFKNSEKQDKSFSSPVLMTDAINKTSANQSYICFSDKENIFFTSFRRIPEGSVMNIFQSRFLKNNWQEGEPIISLESDNFRFHPTVSPSGRIMIFSEASQSNPEDADLWTAYKNEKNEWFIAEKLDDLNSNLAEITPFFSAEDTLYFSSNGFSGQGGFDIYSSVKINGKWQKPRPVTSLNTEFDESDFTKINPNLAVFSSNRPGGKGGLDLWMTEYLEQESANSEPALKLASTVEEIEIVKIRKFILANSLALNKTKLSPDNISKINESVIKIYSDSFSVKPEYLETTIYPLFSKEFSKVELKFTGDNFADSILLKKNAETSITNLLDLTQYTKKLYGSNILMLSAALVNSEDKHLSEKFKQIDIFNSTKEVPEEITYNGNKFNVRILILPDNLDEKSLSGFSEYIRQVKSPFKNSKKVLIESSPTFGLMENQLIRDWCKVVFSDIKDVLFQKGIFQNISEYISVNNLNYLIVFIEN